MYRSGHYIVFFCRHRMFSFSMESITVRINGIILQRLETHWTLNTKHSQISLNLIIINISNASKCVARIFRFRPCWIYVLIWISEIISNELNFQSERRSMTKMHLFSIFIYLVSNARLWIKCPLQSFMSVFSVQFYRFYLYLFILLHQLDRIVLKLHTYQIREHN